MKQVGKDDLLLSRGANPRTGVISPNKLSFDGSNQDSEQQQRKDQEQIATPRWQQRGDQWINTEDRMRRHGMRPQGRAGKYIQESRLRTPLRLGDHTTRGPGSRPPTRPGHILHAPGQPIREMHLLQPNEAKIGTDRMEPVCNPDALPIIDPSPKTNRPNLQTGLASHKNMDTEYLVPSPLLVNTRRKPGHSSRSSSAPTPRKHEYPGSVPGKSLPMLHGVPVDDGKLLSLVEERYGKNMSPGQGGLRQPTQENVDHRFERSVYRKIDKELPQLPEGHVTCVLNGTPASGQILTHKTRSQSQAVSTTPISRNLLSMPHQGTHEHHATSGRSDSKEHNATTIQPRRKMTTPVAAVPIYDNPPQRPIAPYASGNSVLRYASEQNIKLFDEPVNHLNREDPFTGPRPNPGTFTDTSIRSFPAGARGKVPISKNGIGRTCSHCHHISFRNITGENPDLQRSPIGDDASKPPLPITSTPKKFQPIVQIPTSGPQISSLTAVHSPLEQYVAKPHDNRSSGSQLSELSELFISSKDTTLVTGIDNPYHVACCQECCSSGCHNGCLGHTSPGRSQAMLAPAHNQSVSISEAQTRRTAADRDGAFPSPRIPRSALQDEHAQHSPSTNENQLKIKKTRLQGSDSKSSLASLFNLKRNLRSDRTPHLGLDGIENNNPGVSPRSNSADAISDNRNITPLTGWTKVRSKSRKISSSTTSLRGMGIPALNNLDLSEIWELLVMPLAAGRMWLQNHPQAKQYFWRVLQYYWDLLRDVQATSQTLLRIVYVYSKTGRFQLDRDMIAADFAGDCLRSALYVVILMASVAVMVRIIRVLLFPFALVVWLLGWLVSGMRQSVGSVA